MRTDLQEFWYQQSDWSQKTFGTDAERGPIGALKHLQKEVEEALQDPKDLMEYVDCVFLIFDAARRAGFTYNELENGIWEKLAINRMRKWTRKSSDEPMEHVRDE